MRRNVELTANVHLEDGSYWADVAELPGCFAAGDDLDELLTSLREGIHLYLDADGDGAPLRIKSAVLTDVSA